MKYIATAILFVSIILLVAYIFVVKLPRDQRLMLSAVTSEPDSYVAYVVDTNATKFQLSNSNVLALLNKTNEQIEISLNDDPKRQFFANWNVGALDDKRELQAPADCRYLVIETYLNQIADAKKLSDIVAGFSCQNSVNPDLKAFISQHED